MTMNPSEVRAWARDNGMSVGKRGRITAELYAAYGKAKAEGCSPQRPMPEHPAPPADAR